MVWYGGGGGGGGGGGSPWPLGWGPRKGDSGVPLGGLVRPIGRFIAPTTVQVIHFLLFS